jgi:hypothetical protein
MEKNKTRERGRGKRAQSFSVRCTFFGNKYYLLLQHWSQGL